MSSKLGRWLEHFQVWLLCVAQHPLHTVPYRVPTTYKPSVHESSFT